MEQTGASKPAMNSQSSIRSFFQPKTASSTASPDPDSSVPPTRLPLPPPPPPSTARPPPSTKYTPPPGAPLQPKSSQPGPSFPMPTPTSHPQATISRIQKHHVEPLRRINSLLLPIAYPDNFYRATTSPATSPNFSRVVLWTDTAGPSTPTPEPKVIGGIVCRLDLDPATQQCTIYIQSLGILAPYRAFGLAMNLLDEVVRYSIEQKAEPCPITSLYAHVWTHNEDGLRWYNARGFEKEGGVIAGYYRKLKPDTAVMMRRAITPSDHLKQMGAQTQSQAQSLAASAELLHRPGLNGSMRGVSYQQKGPDHEWNDLPSDILVPSSSATPRTSTRPSPNASVTSLLSPPTTAEASDGGSSRSSSMTRESRGAARGKKKRVYPAAAFGG